MDSRLEPTDDASRERQPQKAPYEKPVLTKYGDVVSLTRGAAGGGSDNNVVSV